MSIGGNRPDSSTPPSPSRLERLLGFLATDPNNLKLIGDAAVAAYDEHRLEGVSQLLGRYEHLAPLPGPLANLKGRLSLEEGRYADAAAIFEELRQKEGDSAGLRFNLAWAFAMQARYAEALPLLDDETLLISPRAPSLKIQAMHHLALYDDALKVGAELAARFPDDEALMGTLATLALDTNNRELAFSCAKKAGQNPEGCTVLGMIALDEHDSRQSLRIFDQVLIADPFSPRAWVGKGLSLLAAGDAKDAIDAIDRGAALFGTHVGSRLGGCTSWREIRLVRARASNAPARSIPISRSVTADWRCSTLPKTKSQRRNARRRLR
jgi:tetratricopeptide (TPR) repeat protein